MIQLIHFYLRFLFADCLFKWISLIDFKERPLVVVEYAQFGDLLGYLRKSRGMRDNYYSDPSIKPITSLTSKQLLKFAWEISDGMEYLSMKKVKQTSPYIINS